MSTCSLRKQDSSQNQDIVHANILLLVTLCHETQYKLALYMKHYNDPNMTATTHRQRLLHHIHQYNISQQPRKRFFMYNLTPDDLNYLSSFTTNQSSASVTDLTEADMDAVSNHQKISLGFHFATDGVPKSAAGTGDKDEEQITEANIETCLEKYEAMLDAVQQERDAADERRKLEARAAALKLSFS